MEQGYNAIELVYDMLAVNSEPLFKGRGQRCMSQTAFAKACHVDSGSTKNRSHDGERLRRYLIYFGQNKETGKWKYFFYLYSASQKEAIDRAYRAVRMNAIGVDADRALRHYGWETFDFDHNEKIVVVF